MVDQNGARLHAGEGAVWTQHDAAQVVVIANAAKDDIDAFGRLARRAGVRQLTAGTGGLRVRIAPSDRFGSGSVVNRDVVTRLCQVSGHRVTHDAQAQKGDAARGNRFVSSAGHAISFKKAFR